MLADDREPLSVAIEPGLTVRYSRVRIVGKLILQSYFGQ